MKHDEIVAEIQTRARDRGLLSHYCPDSRHCKGDPGFPDVLVAGLYGTVFLEVKTGRQGQTPDQIRWTYTLLGGGELAMIIREVDLGNGTLDALLDKIHHG